MACSRHEKSRAKAAPKETGDIGSVQTDPIDERVADDREGESDQRNEPTENVIEQSRWKMIGLETR
jgi:hypothetical protein